MHKLFTMIIMSFILVACNTPFVTIPPTLTSTPPALCQSSVTADSAIVREINQQFDAFSRGDVNYLVESYSDYYLDFALRMDGTTKDEAQAILRRTFVGSIANGMTYLTCTILQTKVSGTLAFAEIISETTYPEKQGQVQNYYLAFRLEQNRWKQNGGWFTFPDHTIRPILDDLNLASMPAQTINDVTIRPLMLVKHPDKMVFVFQGITGKYASNVNGKVILYFNGSQKSVSNGYTESLSSNLETQNWVEVDGYFEEWPSEITLSGFGTFGAENWDYHFEIPK